MVKPDWFKMNPAMFLQDEVVDAMSALELGAVFRFLCRQWIDGDLSDDITLLARQARITDEEMEAFWPRFSAFFPLLDSGRRANRFMSESRREVVIAMEAKREAGRAAANRRWQKTRTKSTTSMGDPIQEKNKEEQHQENARPYKSRVIDLESIRERAAIR